MSAVYPDLDGAAVLVTGAASGIGAAIALRFAAQGARLALIDRDADALTAVAARCCDAATEALDLRDVDALRGAVARLEAALGPFRALVNNAGDDARHAWDAVTPEMWDDRMAVNLRHQFFTAQAVAPGMAGAGGGAIVNLGSISWMFGAAGLIAYTTAKSAVAGLTKSLARELGPMGVRVMAVAPGMVWTEKQTARAAAEDPGKRGRYLERQCVKEALEPDDVAALVLWLASSEARRCSGQTFVIDGGVV